MPFEDGEADLPQSLSQLVRKGSSIALIAAKEATDVDRIDAVRLVEGLTVIRFRQPVLLPLVNLIVANEVLVFRVDPLDFAVRHRFHASCANHNLLVADCQDGGPDAGRARGRLLCNSVEGG